MGSSTQYCTYQTRFRIFQNGVRWFLHAENSHDRKDLEGAILEKQLTTIKATLSIQRSSCQAGADSLLMIISWIHDNPGLIRLCGLELCDTNELRESKVQISDSSEAKYSGVNSCASCRYFAQ